VTRRVAFLLLLSLGGYSSGVCVGWGWGMLF
jgi:hypothetical protein